MIERFLSVLHSMKLEPTAEELADVLWLASRMGVAVDVPQAERKPDMPTSPPADDSATKPVPPSPARERGVRGVRSDQQGETAADVHQRGPGAPGSATATGGGVPFRSPAAPALPHTLQLGRALRPLKRSVASRSGFTVDEDATAQRIAEHVPFPLVLRPLPARWLDLVVVVDEGSSMAIWRQTARELVTLLERHGAFRRVQRRGILTDGDGELGLVVRSMEQVRPVPWREVLDPGGQRLILLVSDCVAECWEDGRMAGLVRDWSRHGPVALIQVLPESLWYRSGLGTAVPTWLRALAPAAANPQWLVEKKMRALDEDDDEQAALRIALPVAQLERRSLEALARMIAGSGADPVRGVELRVVSVDDDTEQDRDAALTLAADEPSLTAKARVARFRATASPRARKLATLFAAANYLSLPVMRHIRQTMLPEATLGNLAEVFLGGILREVTEGERTTDPEEIRYDFVEGVREILLDAGDVEAAARVLEQVSDYVTTHLGYGTSFRALLADPTGSAVGEAIPEREQPFARIGAMVIERFGGEYARLAKRLVGRGVGGRIAGGGVGATTAKGMAEAIEKEGVLTQQQVIAQLEEYARRYQIIRETMSFSGERLSLMDVLMREVLQFAIHHGIRANVAVELFRRATPGSHIVAFAVLMHDPDPAAFDVVRDGIVASWSGFEQSWALQVALRMLRRLSQDQKVQLHKDLLYHRSGAPETWIRDNADRWELSEQILSELGAFVPEPQEPHVEQSASPREQAPEATAEAAIDGNILLHKHVLAQLEQVAHSYEAIRRELPSGHERTRKLDLMMQEVGDFAKRHPIQANIAIDFFKRGADGSRIVALAILMQDPNAAEFDVVRDAITASRSAFELYWALQVALRMLPHFSWEEKYQLRNDLGYRRNSVLTARLREHPDCLRLSDQILEEIRALLPELHDAPARRAVLTNEQVLSQLQEYALRYESIRKEMPYSDGRTTRLMLFMDQVRRFARRYKIESTIAIDLFKKATPGARIVAFAILMHDPDAAAFDVVQNGIVASRSGLEQHLALQVALRMLPNLSPEQRNQLGEDVLRERRGGPTTRLREESDRWQLSEQILGALNWSGGLMRVFISYAEEDKALLVQLDAHVQHEGAVQTWHRCIEPGQAWKDIDTTMFMKADVIVILLSPDFLCLKDAKEEMTRAVERHETGRTRVIPVILRPVDWSNTPLAHLPALPSSAKPVTEWENRDEAWKDVVQGILRVEDRITKRILVVDDDDSVRNSLCRLCKSMGYETMEAKTNAQAIDWLFGSNIPFGLMTTDAFRRPEHADEQGYVGLDLIKMVNRRLPDLPIVLISRDSPDFLYEQAPNLRISALIQKDIDDAETIDILQRVLAGETLPSPWSNSLVQSKALDLAPQGSEPAAGSEWVNPNDGAVLVYVPGGEFTIGADDHELGRNAQPVHRVRLSPFWIGKFLVTNAQFGQFLRHRPNHRKPAYWEDKDFNAPEQPVVGVTWDDAMAYAEWAGLTLPTEAQWEAAARGPQGSRYPWGNDEPTPERANYSRNLGRTSAVGSYPKGAGHYGTLDQAGNVWEWCFDAWDIEAYTKRQSQGIPRDPVTNPDFVNNIFDNADTDDRVLRGGSWANFSKFLIAAVRYRVRVGYLGWNFGFRCACSVRGDLKPLKG